MITKGDTEFQRRLENIRDMEKNRGVEPLPRKFWEDDPMDYWKYLDSIKPKGGD